MNRFALRGAIAFSIPVLFVFVFSVVHPAGYYFLAAGPLCGLAGGLAFGRRWGLPIVLGLCFGLIGLMFSSTLCANALPGNLISGPSGVFTSSGVIALCGPTISGSSTTQRLGFKMLG